MRKAMDKLGAFYKTQLGQDVVETGLGGAVAAGGQALFTDMSPEEIAMSTALGIGAAAVGRPLMGRAGQAIGNRIDARNPNIAANSQEFINRMINQPTPQLREMVNAKLAPYAKQSASAQLGQLLGRGYGDNVAQALIALSAPGLVNIEKDPQ